ncbi:hypothetical protein M422DRAFT_255366 [Sphaerobolus stellatus SS14]|uniref:Unplaced genomic scaffold SPHSTscaffold_61, whole genome shotgun sequence n=1 Tax=Sphaerobolus stellatus (strain SS14) TaxID=990650 RepID=A0A0C9V3G7_SPHS4|nr:hypothetical protein M422DRAFT_255366 [Sphaerobolus stellatus SS14]
MLVLIIWHPGLNVTRIYCNRESHEAFKLMWLAYFQTVERVTGQKLSLKAFDIDGIMAVILTDGCAAQALGLGDALLELIPPNNQAFAHTAEEIIQHILCTCWVHAHRYIMNLHHLQDECTDEEFEYLCRFCNIQSDPKLKAFEDFCLTHRSVKIQDWCKQKISHKWLWPSLIKRLSKIPSEDWDLNQADTNLNEGSHPDTNHATGTSLTLLEAIEMYVLFLDERKAAELELAKKLCLLPNRHNTDEHRYMNNGRRAIARLKKTVTVKAKDKKLSDINDQIASLRVTIKDLTQQKQGIRNGSSIPTPVEPVPYNTDLHMPPPSADMAELVRSTLPYIDSVTGSADLSPALCLPSSFGGPMPSMSDIDTIFFPSSTAPSSIPF